ncbi:MAG: CHAP domain-containing protein, partial [Clostridia bacterium]|nr:CHAP domain-containing protein [Clostridia bacterium]
MHLFSASIFNVRKLCRSNRSMRFSCAALAAHFLLLEDKMKKILSIIFCISFIIPISIFQVSASYADERWQWTKGVQQERCTYRAWHEAYDRLGISLPLTWGNAGSWAINAAADGYSVDKNPTPNSIACWNGGTWGHVAYVTDVDSYYVYYRHAGINPSSNYTGYWYHDTKRTPAEMDEPGFQGYIHLGDIVDIS